MHTTEIRRLTTNRGAYSLFLAIPQEKQVLGAPDQPESANIHIFCKILPNSRSSGKTGLNIAIAGPYQVNNRRIPLICWSSQCRGVWSNSRVKVQLMGVAVGNPAHIAIVPESVLRARSHDVAFRDLAEPARSPIIMSNRVGDRSPELVAMARVIARKYEQ